MVRDCIGSTRNNHFHKLDAVETKVEILKQDENRGFLPLPDRRRPGGTGAGAPPGLAWPGFVLRTPLILVLTLRQVPLPRNHFRVPAIKLPIFVF